MYIYLLLLCITFSKHLSWSLIPVLIFQHTLIFLDFRISEDCKLHKLHFNCAFWHCTYHAICCYTPNHEMYCISSHTPLSSPSAEKRLPGGRGRHNGPVCNWRLPGKRQEDGNIWRLPAGLLRWREWGVPVRLQGVWSYTPNTWFSMMQGSWFVWWYFQQKLNKNWWRQQKIMYLFLLRHFQAGLQSLTISYFAKFT